MLAFLTSKLFAVVAVPLAAILTTLTVQGLKWASAWLDAQPAYVKRGAAAFFAAVFTALFTALEQAHPCVSNAAGCTIQDLINDPKSLQAAITAALAFIGSLLAHKGIKAAKH